METQREKAEHEEEAPVSECSATRPRRIWTVKRLGAPPEVVQKVPFERGCQEDKRRKRRRADEADERESSGPHAARVRRYVRGLNARNSGQPA